MSSDPYNIDQTPTKSETFDAMFRRLELKARPYLVAGTAIVVIVAAVYGMGFFSIGGRIDVLGVKIEAVDKKIDEVDKRLGGKIDEVDKRLGGKIDDIAKQMDRIEDFLKAELRELRLISANHENRITRAETKLETIPVLPEKR